MDSFITIAMSRRDAAELYMDLEDRIENGDDSGAFHDLRDALEGTL